MLTKNVNSTSFSGIINISIIDIFLLFHPPFNCHPPHLFCQNTTPSFYIYPSILSKFEISATPPPPPPLPPYN